MSTAKEIEDAIRTLEQTERDKLLQHLPQLFPELAGDVEWERIIRDDQPRAAFSKLLDDTAEQLRRSPKAFSPMKLSDFSE